jgi:hypothetical protein
MASKDKYPYQNTSLVNLPKERWKDIPAFEGYYQISNYGRIKSLSREHVMNTPYGGTYISKEKIRKANLEKKHNKTVDESIYTLIIALYGDVGKYHFSVGRLVYYIFKDEFDLEDRNVIISHKDGDGRNVHIDNLIKTDFSTVKLLSYEKGRAISHLSVLSKPVTQFDAKGKPVGSYPSMYEAGKQLGINSTNIAEIVTGRGHMYKGFFWKEGEHSKTLDLKKIERNIAREPIHTSLVKRLGIKRLDTKNPPAFLNLSLVSMKGEQWKDVPGYEGLYMISNFGRTKALSKITEGKQQRWMPEQIQRITVDFRLDASGKEIPGSTFVCMAKNGKKKLVSVPRLVFYLFVKKFDLSDTGLRIYYSDGHSLNTHYKNLVLKSSSWSFAGK